ncbi:DUF4276 family protein [Hyalangium sp.]|uniref:DUF4276 family protein n=1 Tax=Hyalangium sp. TaxID=2028555 RepID=UPI002D40D13C|nr:DUF4276 family protein [Hyalangium sp.]HYI03062.1 DUF4276 family protein [Hyalangium sp.]
MIIHALVEGPSERALFSSWMPRVLSGHTVRVYPHQGKGRLPTKLTKKPDPKHRGLLDQLPAKLAAFQASSDHNDEAVLIVVDADADDWVELISEISSVAKKLAPNLRVLVKVAVEETEAFYLGDLRALERAYPDANMKAARDYTPDSICGTWEIFGRIIGDDGGNKVAWAEAMGPRLTTNAAKSRSPSFKDLCSALSKLAPKPAPKKKRRRFRHIPKSMKKRR